MSKKLFLFACFASSIFYASENKLSYAQDKAEILNTHPKYSVSVSGPIDVPVVPFDFYAVFITSKRSFKNKSCTTFRTPIKSVSWVEYKKHDLLHIKFCNGTQEYLAVE